MGQTLSSAAQWTSAREGGRGKLEFTPINELILNRIVKFAEDFPSAHREECKLVFKQPLSWHTELLPSSFHSGCSDKGDQIVSDAVFNDKPLLILDKERNNELSVYSMEYIANVLRTAGDRKLTEARACLQENSDPVAKMLGDRFTTLTDSDTSTYRFMEEILRDSDRSHKPTKEDDKEVDKDERENLKRLELKMLLLIKEFDNKLLQEASKLISSEVKLTPDDVNRIFDILKKFSGEDAEKHVLQDINWIEPYAFVFNNGCRAPFWRQIHGDISYIEAKPHDSEPIYITASTNGYFVNKGLTGEKKELLFDKEGNYYRDLVALLREKSPHFGKKIEEQEFFKVDDNKSTMLIRRDSDLLDANKTKGERGTKHTEDEGLKRQDKKHKEDASRKMEPSDKWKSLATQGTDDQDKTKVQNQHEQKRKTARKTMSKKQLHKSDDVDDSFEESSSESDDEEDGYDRYQELPADLPSEYWQIQKLVKYLKGGNQTATIIALCSLRDFGLHQEACQLAIKEVGGLQILLNLLETEDVKCKIGSLKILKEISENVQIRRTIADLGGLKTMVKLLRDPNKDLKCLAAETIANVARFRRARRTVRQHGGIKRLVALLDCTLGSTVAESQKNVDVARCGALALWSCSKSEKNKDAMRKAGIIPLLAKLLKSPHENILIPVVGILQECASEPSYRLAIRTEGMIEGLVKNLSSKNEELQMHCACAIFRCAEDRETRDLVRRYGGLDPLVGLLSKTDNKKLLSAATGAIWKCAKSPENVVRFQELNAIDVLVALLQNQPDEVLINVVGALAELAHDPPNRAAIRKANGLDPLVALLTGTNQPLLVNVTRAVGQCAEDPENMLIIDRLDGVRLLWSLLKNPNPEVQSSAAWALCPCIENVKDAGEMVRSFVSGLELIISLLKSNDKEVLASICAAIARIAKDEENLAVITDHGVVPMLARLTDTGDDKLRRYLAEAIARCCNWGDNRERFGKEGAVAPLVGYLKSKDGAVHRTTAGALYQLSKQSRNCVTMHESGVVKPLIKMVGSDDHQLQENAAGCLGNIRRLALANEKSRQK